MTPGCQGLIGERADPVPHPQSSCRAREPDCYAGDTGEEGVMTQKGRRSGNAEQGQTTQSEGSRGRAGVTVNLKHDPKLGGWGEEPVCKGNCLREDL